MGNSSVELFSKINVSKSINIKYPPIIIADQLRTPENMGLILRLAANIGAINTYFIINETQNFKKHKINRTSSGAALKINWEIIKQQDLVNLIPKDYLIVAIETSDDSKSLYSFNFPEKTAFLVGNEVLGICEETLKLANHKVYIPIPGVISSLNVSHALSVALFEWLRQQIGS